MSAHGDEAPGEEEPIKMMKDGTESIERFAHFASVLVA